ncbi:MAG: T9SS type A sorting domain-containing protein [Saprospiraceae bacterium]|nr:T9SS type A sorting domain-containing protein [Saprospiraceae bacterium]
MKKIKIFLFIYAFLIHYLCLSQNFTFDFNSSGRRVCLVSSEVDPANETVKVIIHDSLSNSTEPIIINRRKFGTYPWTEMVSDLPAGSGHWQDTVVNKGEIWEYQVRRKNTWNYNFKIYDAIGYTIAAMVSDNTDYKGQLILVAAHDIPDLLPEKYFRLKKELTSDGWFVNELIVSRAAKWDSGNEVVTIKNQISGIYNNAPGNDKPKLLFILGHVPLPRCGSADIDSPDFHEYNKGARGCDVYYADIDGIFTDVATYNPLTHNIPLGYNFPGDFKWDQDFFPSDIEMAFGRIDFADLTDISSPEITLIEKYLDRLSNYRNVAPGFDMGDKSGFYLGYDNSNDGSYRSLPNISGPENVFQNYNGPNHNQWVQVNGPFKIYMQNLLIPDVSDWQTYGMEATVFSSDQSYWGFGDVPQTGDYSRIRSLLGIDSKCVIALWTTTSINVFHQACTGMPLGLAMKEIMNHNASNQYLEKPQQKYDTQDLWNRTHFAFYGDPGLSLYQVAPPANLKLTDLAGKAVLTWESPSDTGILGYHIYKSESEFGKFERVSDSIIKENEYTINDYLTGNWYMVKSVKKITSGCGQFIHPSIGKSLPGNIILSEKDPDVDSFIQLFPNPFKNTIFIKAPLPIEKIEIFSVLGKKIFSSLYIVGPENHLDLSFLENNMYILKIKLTEGKINTLKIIKNN